MAARIEDFAGRITIADGAWGTELDKLGCPPGYCREEWNISQPDRVKQVAAAYAEAGAQIVLTNTFGGNRFTLEKHGFADRVAEFNEAGARLSKMAVGDRAKVFGSIGPSGLMVFTGEVDVKALTEAFTVQAEALAAGGADALVIETMAEIAEAQAAIKAARTTGLLVAACMSFDSGPDKTRTMMGVTPEQAVEALAGAEADIIGCNCGVGIDEYITVAGMMRAVTDKPIWVKANAGLPEIEGSRVVYKMTPEEFAGKVHKLVDAGANIVGGCCGTGPEFIRAIRASLN